MLSVTEIPVVRMKRCERVGAPQLLPGHLPGTHFLNLHFVLLRLPSKHSLLKLHSCLPFCCRFKHRRGGSQPDGFAFVTAIQENPIAYDSRYASVFVGPTRC